MMSVTFRSGWRLYTRRLTLVGFPQGYPTLGLLDRGRHAWVSGPRLGRGERAKSGWLEKN